jgi:hypothetical protein
MAVSMIGVWDRAYMVGFWYPNDSASPYTLRGLSGFRWASRMISCLRLEKLMCWLRWPHDRVFAALWDGEMYNDSSWLGECCVVAGRR